MPLKFAAADLQPLPEFRFPWQRDEALRMRDEMQDPERVYLDDEGVRRWKSNDNAVPASCYSDAYVVEPEVQKVARQRDMNAFAADYRRRRQGRRPSAEEQFEMMAAFGSGVEVVDVLTGDKWRT